MWKLNKTLKNKQWIKEEIKREKRKYLEMNDNKDTTYPNLCDTAKAVLRGKFIAVNSFMKKEGQSQIKNLIYYLKTFGKEKPKFKAGRRKEIIKIRA